MSTLKASEKVPSTPNVISVAWMIRWYSSGPSPRMRKSRARYRPRIASQTRVNDRPRTPYETEIGPLVVLSVLTPNRSTSAIVTAA